MADDIAERFARETADHTMTVLHDDGLYRHLAFRNPKRAWNYWFDLITAPGVLIFQGDGDSYTFRRLDDMFEFFRGSTWNGAPNLGYWAEKLTIPGGQTGVMQYDQDLLAAHVKQSVTDYYDGQDIPDGLVDAVQDQVLDELVGDETTDHGTVDAFSFRVTSDERFRFTDTWEWTCRDYDWWFLWACQAIVWGIAQYDAHAVPRPITGATPRRRKSAAGLPCTPLVAPKPSADMATTATSDPFERPPAMVDVHPPEPAVTS